MPSDRRGFIFGLVGAMAAPAIVRAESVMPLRGASLSKILQSPFEEWIVRWAEKVPGPISTPFDTLFTMRGIGGRHFGVYAPRPSYRLGQSILVFREDET